MKIEIVDNLDKKMKADNMYVREVLKGKKEKKTEKTILITPELFAKIFSPERIKLILRIKKNNLNNIYQLAKELGRKYPAVHRDIKLLEGYGIIKLKTKGKTKIPFMDQPVNFSGFAVSS